MSLDDNNKKNTGGNTEDIFAIMEKYRADQSKSKTAAEQPREPKPDAPVKIPCPNHTPQSPGPNATFRRRPPGHSPQKSPPQSTHRQDTQKKAAFPCQSHSKN